MATSKSSKDVIQHIKAEEQDSYSDDSLFNIKPWGADLSFRELIQRYDDNELVKPELQRQYVWDRAEASRFIDSLLLGLPVPSIFLAQTQDEKLLIIDGFQRIMTVRDYVRGVFSKDDQRFSLSRTSKINRRWRGKLFDELSETEQRRIKNTTIHAIIFAQQMEPAGDDTSLFQVFERINTSGRTLMAQEIRNCVAQGSLNKLLFDLNSNPSWRALFGTVAPDTRMRDMEFILRFFALSSPEFKVYNKEQLSLRQFLDIYMKNNSKADPSKVHELSSRFILCIERAEAWFGKVAFHNVSPSDNTKYVQKFSPTIFDSIMIAIDGANARGILVPSCDPMQARNSLLADEQYRSVIAQETMRKLSIRTRINKASNYLFGVDYE